MEQNKLCDYGCGKEAIYQFKNGKRCCSDKHTKCVGVKQKLSKTIKGQKKPQRTKEHQDKLTESRRKTMFIFSKPFDNKNHVLCSYGCKKLAKFQMKNGKYCCSKNYSSCVGMKKINSKKHFGKKVLNRKSRLYCKDTYDKISRKLKGRNYESLYGKEKAKQLKELKRRLILREGFIGYLHSFIKNPSKPELKLREVVKELYPNCIFSYGILHYAVDIALIDKKIVIESDGEYWHQDKEKDMKRQKKIEDLGWKFIRYSIDTVNQVPPKEKISNDIINICKGDNDG
jgi:hypothetical protein